MLSLRMAASVIAVPLVTAGSSVDFNRALQSVLDSVAIGIGATYPGDCIQFDSTITHRLTIFSSRPHPWSLS